ncbi:MAG: hydrogenase maturation nickel metallochaperone HypA [Fimbriimonas sp.]|nr:hydrogenase maturation nickel metallochaperone HypA [Fimbriimonas sp.]
MHEVGILNQVLEMAIEAAEQECATKIVRLHLLIGELAGVVPEAMAFAFDVASAGTMAEGATFEWDTVKVRCRCSNGCPDFEPDNYVYACPRCGALASELLAGRELQLVDIDIET